MRQFNKCYKLMLIIVSAILTFNSMAQAPIAFGSPYIRNWRSYEKFPYPAISNGYSSPTGFFKIGNTIYSFGESYYKNTAPFSGFEFSVKAFSATTNSWTIKNSNAIPFRSGYIKFVIGNNFYMGSGYNEDGVYPGFCDSTMYKYNSVTDSWSTVAPFPDSSLLVPVCFTLNNKGYVVGGLNGKAGFAASFKTRYYNDTTNTWTDDDDTPAFMSSENSSWKAFTNNGKAYLFSTYFNNMMYEFNPNATTNNKWKLVTAPNADDDFKNYVILETSEGCKIMGGEFQILVDDGNGNSHYDVVYNDTIYNYNASNDTWVKTIGKNKFTNQLFATTINNELFLYNNGSIQDVSIGYGENFQQNTYYGYYDNAFISVPFDTVKVNHNFTGICGNTTPTVSYSVANHLNYDNQFIIVLTRNDGYILDTLATVNDSISGSVQVTMPSYNDVLLKANYSGLENLKLAVLTTSPRTIFGNEVKTFSLVNDPASLQINLSYENEYSCPGTPLKIISRLYQQSPYSFFTPTTTNWGGVSGGQAPAYDTINVLESDSLSGYLSASPISATKTFFCYNVDTTFTYSPVYGYINRKSNPTLDNKFIIQEGNSICVGGNETKHLIARVGPFYDGFGDTTAVNITYSKNGIIFYTKTVNIVHDGTSFQDTITINGVNSNDELQLKMVYNASHCSNTNVDSTIRSIVFKNYENNISSDKMLQYNFNNNLVDSTSNHNNGVGENIAFTADRFGHTNSALRIYRDSTATNISQVVSDTFVNVSGNESRTISFWFKTDSVGYHYASYYGGFSEYSHAPAILGWGTVTGSYNGSSSFIHILPATKAVFFKGNYNDVYTPDNVFKFNEWTHVAFVYDGSNFNLYVNGKCQAHSFDYTPIVATNGYYAYNNALNTTNTRLTIGNNGNGVNFNSVYDAPFDGSVDDILIYNKAMTACQIDSLFKRVETGGCTPTSSIKNVSVCSNQLPYMFRTKSYSNAGIFKDTLHNIAGCDSIITINLTIKQTSAKTIDTSICAGSAYLFKSINRTTAGTYKDTLVNAVSCDSIVTLHLAIKQKSATTINAGVCAGDAYTFKGNNLTVAGTYQDTLVNAVGCDSIVTLNLKIKIATDTTLYRPICAGQSLTIFGETYTDAGIHHLTRTNMADCDSNITLIITIKQPTTSIKNDTICSTFLPYTWNGLTFTSAGTKTKTGLINAVGCDSSATLNLVVKQATSSTTIDSIFSGNSYSFNGNNYTTANTYTAHLTNAAGCDSVATLVLIVKPSIAATITGNLVGCSYVLTNSLNANIGGGNWRSSNNNVATINQFGVITNKINGTTIITYTYYKNGQAIISTVTYTVAVVPALNAITGATSVCVGSNATLSNTVLGGIWSSLNNRANINASSGVLTGASTGNASIKYTITNVNGCSNFAAYSPTILSIPNVPSIQYAAGTTNPQTGAGGAFCANRTFTVVGSPTGGIWSSTGALSVGALSGIVTTGNSAGAGTLTYTYTNGSGCSNSRTITGNISVCASRGVNGASSEKLVTSNEFTMYPNPAKTFICLNVNTLIGAGTIVVTDLYGKQVKTQPLSLGNNMVDVSTLNKTVYLVSVITNEGKTTKKLVVE